MREWCGCVNRTRRSRLEGWSAYSWSSTLLLADSFLSCRTCRPMKWPLSRLKNQNDKSRQMRARFKPVLITRASRTLSARWTKFYPGNGIQGNLMSIARKKINKRRRIGRRRSPIPLKKRKIHNRRVHTHPQLHLLRAVGRGVDHLGVVEGEEGAEEEERLRRQKLLVLCPPTLHGQNLGLSHRNHLHCPQRRRRRRKRLIHNIYPCSEDFGCFVFLNCPRCMHIPSLTPSTPQD